MITPIKNSLFALCTALVMGSTIQSVYAADQAPTQTIAFDDEIGENWTFVQQIDGISVSFTTISVDQEQFLAVKFENTTSEAVDFIWSMTRNNEMLRITEDEMAEARVQIPSSESEIYDGSYLIELTDEDQLSDFVISIKSTKH